MIQFNSIQFNSIQFNSIQFDRSIFKDELSMVAEVVVVVEILIQDGSILADYGIESPSESSVE